jgi:hypothetical protein
LAAEQPLSFPLVLMDEASQMPEPVSLLPLIAAGQPHKLLLVSEHASNHMLNSPADSSTLQYDDVKFLLKQIDD